MDGLRVGTGTPGRDDLNTRWGDAMVRLLVIKGTPPDCERPTFATTPEVLYRDQPQHLRVQPLTVECEGLFETA